MAAEVRLAFEAAAAAPLVLPPAFPASDAVPDVMCGFAGKGCKRLDDLLDILSQVFPENLCLATYLAMFRSVCLGDPAKELEAMREWYRQMKFVGGERRSPDLFQVALQGRSDLLMEARVPLLESIDARSMYDKLTEVERQDVLKHIVSVNHAANVVHNLPSSLLECLVGIVCSRCEPGTSISFQQLAPMAQEALCAGATDGMSIGERIETWSREIGPFIDEGGLLSLADMIDEKEPGAAELKAQMLNVMELVSAAGGSSAAAASGGGAMTMLAPLLSLFGGGGK